MGVSSMADKLVAGLNPFFSHYTRHRVTAFLVFLVMIAGTFAIYWQNQECTFTSTIESRVEKILGELPDQKAFVDRTMDASADRLPEGSSRHVDMCTLNVDRMNTRNVEGETGMLTLFGNAGGSCEYGSNEYWESPAMASFPHAFHWCTWTEANKTRERDTLVEQQRLVLPPTVADGFGRNFHNDAIDAFIKEPRAVIAGSLLKEATMFDLFELKSAAWSELNKKMDGPEAAHIEDRWNMHKCILSSEPFNIDQYKGSCVSVPDEIWTSSKYAERWCGLHHESYCLEKNIVTPPGKPHSAESEDKFCAESLAHPWRDYKQVPANGGLYQHTYQVTVNTTLRVCPNKFTAVGAALGFITYIEVLATLLIGGLFILCGISKPTTKEASFLNLLRGAGIAEIDKHQYGP
jgi:hypothetical protein